MTTANSRHTAIASADDNGTQRARAVTSANWTGSDKQVTGPRALRRTATIRWAVLAVAAPVLLLTGCTATATATGHPAAAPDLGRWQPPAVLAQHLPDLLLNENDVNTLAHTTAMVVRKPISRMWHDEDIVSNPSCLDTYSPAEAEVYDGSNWTAVQGQILNDAEPGPPEHALIQALIAFRDAESAQQFFTQAKTRWSGCANQSITVTPPEHAPITWNLGQPQITDTTLATTQTQSPGRGPTCQRALGMANNVVIDTLWCGYDTTTQASDIVAKTTTAISQA